MLLSQQVRSKYLFTSPLEIVVATAVCHGYTRLVRNALLAAVGGGGFTMRSQIMPIISAICFLSSLQLPGLAQAVGDEFCSAGIPCNNMTVYLIHRKGAISKTQTMAQSEKFLTLAEALSQKKVVINETGDVNKLTLQNFGNLPVFIQGGDIIKGGRQDRALQSDIVLPPKSKAIAANVFCVESGRWEKRGYEDDKQFSSSLTSLPTKELKMAANARGDQSAVWNSVAQLQHDAEKSAHKPVASPTSPSSLELTLENRNVQQQVAQYMQKLTPSIADQQDVVGCAVAINGKVTGGDVYGSHALFMKMWPKLINASAVEAFVNQQQQGKLVPPPPAAAVMPMLQGATNGTIGSVQKGGLADVQLRETKSNIMLKTQDSRGEEYHRNYLMK